MQIISIPVHCFTCSLMMPNIRTLHGPMYYKTGDTCVYNGHVCYTLL